MPVNRSPEAEAWARVEAILDAVLDAKAEDRATAREVARARCDVPAVVNEVERLWLALRGGSAAFERPLAAEMPELLADLDAGGRELPSRAGSLVGSYRLTERIGRGGMGVVWAAVRADDQYEKRVAVKLLPRGLESTEAQRRFLTERQILADLEHPHIARLLDGGVTEEGFPYLVMELVSGRPIDESCAATQADLEQRLELFLQACEAVQFAHQNLVVHRDLKPSNILVTGSGEVRLLDFGIAKWLDGAGASGGGGSTVMQPGTPAYASPEQLANRPVSTAADVYSLGVVLYRLLTGSLPFELEGLSAGQIEALVSTREVEPPSAAAARRERSGEGRPPVASRRLRGDLDTVVAKALRKQPSRRYATVEQLAGDLRAVLAARPISARRASAAYRARKFLARHRLGVSAATLVAASLVTGVVGVVWQSRLAGAEAAKATHTAELLASVFGAADPWRSERAEVSLRSVLERGVERIDRELAGEPAVRATLLATMGRSFTGIGEYGRAIELHRRALALRRVLAGADGVEVAESQLDLGSALTARGDYAAAEPLLVAAKRSFERAPAGGERLAETLTALGALEQATGEFALAERHLRESRRLRRSLARGDEPEDVGTLTLLAAALDRQGRDREATAIQRRALASALSEFDEDHPAVASISNDLAIALHRLGRYEEARELYLRALSIQEVALGPDHAQVADILSNLGKLLMDRGRYEESRPYVVRAAETKRARLSPNSFTRLASEVNLATLHRELGDLERAEAIYRDVLARFSALQGEEHGLTARVRSHLALTLARRGRVEEAERAYRRALAVQRRPGAAEATHRAETAIGLGALLTGSGRATEAEGLLRETIEELAGAQEEGGLQLALARVELGAALVARRRAAEAAPLVAAGRSGLERLLDARDPRRLRADEIATRIEQSDAED